jgi:putative SOS response-associated peptidase YedK
MCGRYSLDDLDGRFSSRFKIANYIEKLQPRFNVYPGQPMPVVVPKVERGRQLRIADAMEWGLIPSWTKDLSKAPRPINARAETVQTLASFRGPFRQKRCLIPASSFFEWKSTPL